MAEKHTNRRTEADGKRPPLFLVITHTPNGKPSVKIEPQICPDKNALTQYFDQTFGVGNFREDTISSGNITVILGQRGNRIYSLLSALATHTELEEWLKQCGGKLETISWKFQMGHGATYTQLRHFTPEEGYDSLNPVIDFLNGQSLLPSWTKGMKQTPPGGNPNNN